jgi:hypothetical protein
MSAHTLNILIEKINRAIGVLFSSRTTLVISSAHDCAHASVSARFIRNTGWTLLEQQTELRLKCSEMEKDG